MADADDEYSEAEGKSRLANFYKVYRPWLFVGLMLSICGYVGLYLFIAWWNFTYVTNATSKSPFDFKASVVNAILGFGEANLTNIGATSILAIASYFIYKWLMTGAIEEEQDLFAKRVARHVNAKLSKGIIGVRDNLDTRYIGSLFGTTSKAVIIETWFGPEFQKMKDGLFESFSRGHATTIYLLHPNSTAVKRRSADIFPHSKKSIGRRLVIDSLMQIKAFRDEWVSQNADIPDVQSRINEQLKVYCYDALPGLQVYKAQHRMMVDFFLNELICPDGYQLDVAVKSDLGEAVCKHIKAFERKNSKYFTEVRLDKDIVGQFSSVHLECQLEDAANQVINLDESEIKRFSDLLVAMLNEPERLRYFDSRKATLLSAIDMIRLNLQNSTIEEQKS